MKPRPRVVASLLVLIAALTPAGVPALAQGPVVRAILFFSPTCPHCHEVIRRDLPIVFSHFGGEPRVYFNQDLRADQLAFYNVTNGTVEILLADVSRVEGYDLFAACDERYRDILKGSRGVPRLVIGDTVLIGSLDIPSNLPHLVAEGLAAGGIDWPDVVGMQQAIASIPGPQLAVADTVAEVEGERVAAEGAEGAAETPAASEPEAAPATESPAATEPAEPVTTAEVERLPGHGPEREGAPPAAGTETPVGARPGPETGPGDAGPPANPEGVTEADEPGDASGTSLAVIPERRLTVIELYNQDRVGNSMSVVVLVAMVISLMIVASRPHLPVWRREPGVEVLLISILGIGVASYLTYVESRGVLAVCGPVGDCNTVQQSEYAKLFGLIPVGALGLAGYVAIIAAWWMTKRYSGAAADWARLSLLGMTVFGTLFSVYLTFLEPFVIGATCAWCLTSAVIMTVLMWVFVRPGAEAWARIRSTR